MRPTSERQDVRGSFIEVVNSGPWETVITGSMREGSVLGNHYHRRTRMYFFLVHGAAEVAVVSVASGARDSCALDAQEGIYLEVGQAHAIRFTEESAFLLLKSRAYREDDPDTVPFTVMEPESSLEP
jgi:dTDP-4-dehydrorhamnose 3,5-epimerase-like enzyme